LKLKKKQTFYYLLKRKSFLVHGLEQTSKISLLIDASPHIFDQFYYHYLNTINILIDKRFFNRILITENRFVLDCLNVLLSLPSDSFIWNEVLDDFI